MAVGYEHIVHLVADHRVVPGSTRQNEITGEDDDDEGGKVDVVEVKADCLHRSCVDEDSSEVAVKTGLLIINRVLEIRFFVAQSVTATEQWIVENRKVYFIVDHLLEKFCGYFIQFVVVQQNRLK